MLHHGGDGDGGHDQNGGQVKFAQLEGGQAHNGGGGHIGEVQNGGAVGIGKAHGIHNEGHGIGDDHAQQNGDDFEHSLAPDVEDHDDRQGHQRQEPVLGGVGHSGGGQGQADADDDGAGDHGGQEAHDLVHTHDLDDQGQDKVQKAGHHDAAAGIGQLFSVGHVGKNAGVQLRHGGKAAQEGEGGAQERGHLQLGADVEEQGADAGEEQGDLDREALAVEVVVHQDGHQNGGAEHGEHMLETQQEHLGRAEGAGVPDDLPGLLRIFTQGTFLLFFL